MLNYTLKQWSAAKTKELKVSGLDEKLLKDLREDSVDEAVVSEELNALQDDDLRTFDPSNKLAHLLHSTPTEIFLVVLVIVDVIALLAMLVLDLNILQMIQKVIEDTHAKAVKSLQKNCKGNEALRDYDGSSLTKVTKLLETHGCVWTPADLYGYNDTTTTELHSDRYRRAAVPTEDGVPVNKTITLLSNIGHALHILSIVLLAVMVVEVILKIFALGGKYFKGKLEVIDGIVIIISFTMDLYFVDGVLADGVSNAATILVILLLWRIIRVFNAILVTAKKRLQFRIRVQKRMRKNLDEKIEELDDEVKTLQTHIANLERAASRHSIPEYEITACKPVVKHIKKKSTTAGLASMMHMSMGLLHGMNNINTAGKTPNSSLMRRPSLISEEEVEEPPQDVATVLKDAMLVNETIHTENECVKNLPNHQKHKRSNSDTALFSTVDVVTAVATGGEELIVNQEELQAKTVEQEVLQKTPSVKTASVPGVDFVAAVATGVTNHITHVPQKHVEKTPTENDSVNNVADTISAPNLAQTAEPFSHNNNANGCIANNHQQPELSPHSNDANGSIPNDQQQEVSLSNK